MPAPPRPGRWDLAAALAVIGVLVLAYAVVPQPVVQYGAWLVVFCIWMLWFVSFGVRWLYDEDA